VPKKLYETVQSEVRNGLSTIELRRSQSMRSIKIILPYLCADLTGRGDVRMETVGFRREVTGAARA
jgi:hypothetical protein